MLSFLYQIATSCNKPDRSQKQLQPSRNTESLKKAITRPQAHFLNSTTIKKEDSIMKHRTTCNFDATVLWPKSYGHKKRKRLTFAFP